MLTPSRKSKLQLNVKSYRKKYLDKNLTELDESGTRIMINNFLSEVLGYTPLEEIKTEYMIKGTYADYVIQTGGIRHFLVEVKALSFQLSEKHLRQTINYGANEGIEWALLTNGKNFDFYRILFNKPIEARKIFSIDLSDGSTIKKDVDFLQFLHKDAIIKKSLKILWNKFEALNPLNVASVLLCKEVVNIIKRLIKNRYNERCQDEEILVALHRIILDKIDPATIKAFKSGKGERKSKKSNKEEKVIEELAKVQEEISAKADPE
jgi:hypothetical protein